MYPYTAKNYITLKNTSTKSKHFNNVMQLTEKQFYVFLFNYLL